jgi:hypothetical protein
LEGLKRKEESPARKRKKTKQPYHHQPIQEEY